MDYQGRYYRKVTLSGNDYIYANFGTRGVIRIYNVDNCLIKTFNKYHARKIANECKYVYSRIHKEAFNVSTNSLAWEIIAHVYPTEFITAIKSEKLPKKVQNLLSAFAASFSAHTDIIDCGDDRLVRDNNRKYWDLIAGDSNIVDMILEKDFNLSIFD